MLATRAVRAALLVPAIAAVAVSLAMNAYFWHQTLHADAAAQTLFVALSLISGTIKVAVPLYCVQLGVSLASDRGLMAMFAVALTFDVASGIGFANMTREAATAERLRGSAPTTEMRRQLKEAAETADRFRHAPLTDRVRVDYDAARRRAPDCSLRRHAAGDPCVAVTRLASQLAESEARDRAVREVTRLSETLAAAPPEQDADPQITAIVSGLRMLGLEADPDLLAKAFGALVVLLIELISSIGPAKALRPVLPAQAPEPPGSLDRSDPPRPKRPPPAAGSDLLDVLRRIHVSDLAVPGATVAPDGWIYVSQSALAKATGVTSPTVCRRLKALETAGAIETNTSGRNTAVRVIYPTKSSRNIGLSPATGTHVTPGVPC